MYGLCLPFVASRADAALKWDCEGLTVRAIASFDRPDKANAPVWVVSGTHLISISRVVIELRGYRASS